MDEEKQVIKDYKSLYQSTNDMAKTNETRNFNFFITNPEFDHIAVTYSMENKEEFWGLDCSVGEQQIIQWLISEKSPFANKKELDDKVTELIQRDLWHFEISDSQSDVLKRAMCKRVLLTFAFHFFFEYNCTDEIADVLKEVWKETENVSFDMIDINPALLHLSEKKDSAWKLNGRLNDAVIDELHKKGVRYSLECRNGEYQIILTASDEGNSILDFYKDKEIISAVKCVSSDFYSGAMVRVKKIREQKNYGNERVFSYLFDLGSVSYATHLGLKDPRAGYISMYFSDEEKNALRQFDESESDLQDRLISKLEDTNCSSNERISAINYYLEHSKSTHGMNTSANILAANDYLVCTKRGSKTFDSETIYCSSNGVCEKFDEKVTYYRNAVSCDLPTIADQHSFGSFGSEMTRETYAELGVFIDPTLWQYYGFTVMGYRSSSKHRFPLHFNVLAHASTDKTIKEIRKSSKKAVEKDENENIYGISIELANNRLDALNIKLSHIFKVIYSHKDLIADSLILFTVGSLFYEKITDKMNVWQSILMTIYNISFVEWISLFVAFLTLSFTLVEVKSIITEALQKHSRTYFFVRKNKKDNQRIIGKCLKKVLKNAGCNKSNPVFELLLQLYYNSRVNQAEDNKNTL